MSSIVYCLTNPAMPGYVKIGITEDLIQRLNPLLKKSKKPRVVITASDVHDPDSPGGQIGEKAGLNNLQGIRNSSEFEMIDDYNEYDSQTESPKDKEDDLLQIPAFLRRQAN